MCFHDTALCLSIFSVLHRCSRTIHRFPFTTRQFMEDITWQHRTLDRCHIKWETCFYYYAWFILSIWALTKQPFAHSSIVGRTMQMSCRKFKPAINLYISQSQWNQWTPLPFAAWYIYSFLASFISWNQLKMRENSKLRCILETITSTLLFRVVFLVRLIISLV